MKLHISPTTMEQIKDFRDRCGMYVQDAKREARLVNLQEACTRAHTARDVAQLLIEVIKEIRTTK